MKKKVNSKTLKGIMLGTLIGIIITGSVGAVAMTIDARELSYTPQNENFEANNAKEALDGLYNMMEENKNNGINENSVISFSIEAHRTDTKVGEPSRVYSFDGAATVSDYISVSSVDLRTTTVVKDFSAYVLGASLISHGTHSIFINGEKTGTFTHNYVTNVHENSVFKMNFKAGDVLTFSVGPGNSTGMNGTLWAFYII